MLSTNTGPDSRASWQMVCYYSSYNILAHKSLLLTSFLRDFPVGNYWAKGSFAKPLTSTAKLLTNSLFRNKSTYLPTIRYKACTLNSTYHSLWMVCCTCKLKGWFSACLDALESWLLNFLIAKCLSLAFPLLQIEPSFHRWMSSSTPNVHTG